ncbi:hypothetical protein ACF1A5_11385 [Streptomyces sp. NPDC014864]|uniref:hypothetical protein n=1 Tax=Streptomyces sp. NPDC014864 TaxID=3364924 RepID=UPI00370171F3
MAGKRTHRYCGGKGWITLTSGAEATCQPCGGKGWTPVYTAAERAEMDAQRKRETKAAETCERRAREIATGSSRDGYVRVVQMGFWHLREHAPERFATMLRSLDAGRLDDVVKALHAYFIGQRDAGL